MPAASMKDWLSTNRLLPSWALSALVHAGLIWLLLWLAPTWTRPPVGFQDEPTQEIGIFVRERGELLEPHEATQADGRAGEADASPIPTDPLAPQRAVPDAPAVTTPLPTQDSLPGIGPGAAFAEDGLPDPKDLIKSSGTGTGGTGTASGGLPGASFMGVKDNGTRVVYVVDASGSMYHHNAMGKAKAALVASLQSLEPGQQFQIIFYNETPRVMSLKSAPKKQLYFATDLNKTAARQFIQQIDPDLGTEHLMAIKLGLGFSPEVMFVLTDSGDPRLTARELDEIEKRNGGRTRIHCIEFGIGKELGGDSLNFLKKLARQNDGTHRYVDVTESGRK